MFYTIYDAIVFKADKDGIKEDEVKKRLRKRGLTSEGSRRCSGKGTERQ